MRANANNDEPFGLLRTLLVGLGIAQVANHDRPGLFYLLLRAVPDEHRLATPRNHNTLTFLDSAKIDFRRGKRQRIRSRIEGVQKGP